jgi:hypothetical protein
MEIPAAERGLISTSLRSEHPDLLDLPWSFPLVEWKDRCPRLEELPVGDSRHIVVFVNYDGVLYALKELAVGAAEKEYGLLRRMEDTGLPVVHPVGHVVARNHEQATSVLVTRYLDRSLPYQMLFRSGRLARYRDHLMDAMAILLVQLHLAGVFWGDCSLNNALFRRDAGALQAYMVDAETSEIQPQLSDGMREYDLEITEENVYGALLDLQAWGVLDRDFPVRTIGGYLRQRYQELWNEVKREEVLALEERYRIQERVRSLNALGFSVDEVELSTTEGGARLRYRVLVTDRNFHRTQLQTLTGIDAEEGQARHMINEIQELKATLSQSRRRSLPLSAAAFYWLEQRFLPISETLADTATDDDVGAVELYCELLEHKWYLSERAQRDVGHAVALDDYLETRSRPKACESESVDCVQTAESDHA